MRSVRWGTNVAPSLTTSETEAPTGSRSSPISTPASLEPLGTWICSRSADTRSSGAASTSMSRASSLRTPHHAASLDSGAACTSV